MHGGRIGDPSKMAAAQYVSSNRQRQSMGRLPIYVYVTEAVQYYFPGIHFAARMKLPAEAPPAVCVSE